MSPVDTNITGESYEKPWSSQLWRRFLVTVVGFFSGGMLSLGFRCVAWTVWSVKDYFCGTASSIPERCRLEARTVHDRDEEIDMVANGIQNVRKTSFNVRRDSEDVPQSPSKVRRDSEDVLKTLPNVRSDLQMSNLRRDSE
ncbi:unnamed protein product [Heligmosomoides polygyrus]|uniref:Transmembrane protein n=1 Tax=Heligmosomoides polygyrus TaxID=6339 RepID=A0A183FTI2_HELPZ|nr:unnamed protein product [Heligmosomoides polygyrus]